MAAILGRTQQRQRVRTLRVPWECGLPLIGFRTADHLSEHGRDAVLQSAAVHVKLVEVVSTLPIHRPDSLYSYSFVIRDP